MSKDDNDILTGKRHYVYIMYILIIIICEFIRRTMSASRLNLRRRNYFFLFSASCETCSLGVVLY